MGTFDKVVHNYIGNKILIISCTPSLDENCFQQILEDLGHGAISMLKHPGLFIHSIRRTMQIPAMFGHCGGLNGRKETKLEWRGCE